MTTRLLVCLALLGMNVACAAAEEAFTPPPGATVLYRQDFESGDLDGWAGKLTVAHPRFGSKAALEIGPALNESRRAVNIPVTEETVLEFDLYTDDSPSLFVQCLNPKVNDNFKSFWYLYPNRDYGKWVHVRWPITGTLVDSETNWRTVTRPGDLLADIQFHKWVAKTSVLIDNIVVYNIGGPCKLAQAQRTLDECSAALKHLDENVAALKPTTSKLAADAALIAADVKKLADQKDLAYADAKALYDKAAALKNIADRCAEYYAKAVASFGAEPDFALGTEHSMVRISDLNDMYPFRGKVTGEHQLYSARHEYESFQAVVLPFTKNLEKVDVAFSDLKRIGAEGVITAANCTWREQPYVQLRPTYCYPGTDWLAPVPDPLLPGKPFDLPLDHFKPLWITVYTPPDAPAGDYEGTMTVTPANAKPAALKVKLHVWDYNIPVTGRFRGQTHFDLGAVGGFYGKRVDDAVRRQWYDFILKYRFSPTAQYGHGISPDPADLDFVKERGNNVWILAGRGKDNFVREYEWAKKNGVLDYSLVYASDEPRAFDGVRKLANSIHAKFPGVKVMVGGSRPRKELVGYVDIWDPIMSEGGTYGFDPKEIRDALDRGEEVMWYVAAGPQHPYPNVQMGDPLYASRVLFWLTWKYRITGFEYYYWNMWRDNARTTPRWPESPWITYSFKSRANNYNGDGMLCYPGPDGPAASVRLENIRDGIEDWETMYLLEGAAEAAGQLPTFRSRPELERATAILAIDDSFAKNPTHWTLDPAGLQKRRQEASGLLESLIRTIGKEEFAAFEKKRLEDRKKLEAKRLEENRQQALQELGQTK